MRARHSQVQIRYVSDLSDTAWYFDRTIFTCVTPTRTTTGFTNAGYPCLSPDMSQRYLIRPLPKTVWSGTQESTITVTQQYDTAAQFYRLSLPPAVHKSQLPGLWLTKISRGRTY